MILPDATKDPIQPTMCDPKLWPIKWNDSIGAPVFFIKKSTKALNKLRINYQFPPLNKHLNL